MTGSTRNKVNPAFWERLLVSPLQIFTDLLLNGYHQDKWNHNQKAISIGRSRNLFRPQEIDVVRLEKTDIVRHRLVQRVVNAYGEQEVHGNTPDG